MEKQVDKKFTWVIKNFNSLHSECIFSDEFIISGCKWRLQAYPNGYETEDYFSLCLQVSDYQSLPCGWKRHARASFTIVNQIPRRVSQRQETQGWFDMNTIYYGFDYMLPLTTLKARNGGFLVNGEVKIVAKVDVFEVIGNSDVSKDSSKKILVNGVHVLPSEVKYVKSIFKKHPDIALELRSKNPHLWTGYMNVLLSINQKLYQSAQELSNDDLSDAGMALEYLTDAGFKMDRLEKKLEQVKYKCLDQEAQIDIEEPIKQSGWLQKLLSCLMF